MAAEEPRPVLWTLEMVVIVGQKGGRDARDFVVIGSERDESYYKNTNK
jgi:hypothetical protein